jgi:hypothetical protein
MWCHTGDICIWNKVEYLEKGASYQNSIKEILSDLCNATINLWGEISYHRHFKLNKIAMGNGFRGLYSQDQVHCPKYTLFNLQGHMFLLQWHKVCQKTRSFDAWYILNGSQIYISGLYFSVYNRSRNACNITNGFTIGGFMIMAISQPRPQALLIVHAVPWRTVSTFFHPANRPLDFFINSVRVRVGFGLVT